MKRLLPMAQWLVTLLLCLFLIVPVALSMAVGLARNYIRGFKSGWTFDWVAQVWETYHASIWMSLLVALCTLAIVLAAGVPAGYVLARRQSRASRLVEECLTLPVALPGLATALGLIIAYGGVGAFRESVWFIVCGHVVFTLPFMVRAVAAVCAAQDLKTLEEGAASLGATFWQRFRTIVLPNARPGILAGALTVVTLSVGEFNLTWMLHTPQTKTLPVGLADTYASMRLEIASAYTLIFFVMIVPLLVLMQRFGGLRTTNGNPSR
ncbi:ABC transporter permease [Ralstonia pseudosolanacearum]|uniref:ABC transporter permease n=1 Tax=Ralstonia pseudosolanacearum TaxID=1310165 RepID=UPI00048CC198|nr:ABC transporter permease [Ralstonia pseudosolanacearum]MDO3508980.1 ABC transporter permease [Ralstonia pseudosolanacearum]MDO3512274.1 ABC transporter permease [Ralstonia pseudosolanacearum]MDO3539155.1 ABC transporter permease [Ralstonia pseudosolanacearum]MDO3558502.1 ABC transporter permease [Ralstonia pseudosolanacearum]MDO3575416.1 ABC transporter permease [Ralstonia pseudosolanacearum]